MDEARRQDPSFRVPPVRLWIKNVLGAKICRSRDTNPFSKGLRTAPKICFYLNSYVSANPIVQAGVSPRTFGI